MVNQEKSSQPFLDEVQQAEQSACFSRFGTVVELNPNNETVRVDFEGNPYGAPLSAKLGRAFTRSEIQLAIDNGLNCRIEFVNGDISLPMLTDIFFSLLSDEDVLHLRANKIVIEAKDQVMIKSGETSTKLSGRDGRVTTSGKYVTSQAEKANKVLGATVAIN